LPDTAESEWLDRHAQIWLVNADGSVGRKLSTVAAGSIEATGTIGSVIPMGQFLLGDNNVQYQVTEQVFIGSGPTPVPTQATTGGTIGNLDPDTTMAFSPGPPSGVAALTTVIVMEGGADPETDDELRARILRRIQQPPMGGAAYDYEAWALEVPGVSRAWCSPLEMGIGTVTLRFMMDDLRAPTGIPNDSDVAQVYTYVSSKRPVAVKDFWVEAPIPFPIDITIIDLVVDNESTEGSIYNQLVEMFYERAVPGSPMYRSWVDEAISIAVGEDHHETSYQTTNMAGNGYLPILGTITYTTAQNLLWPPPGT
jgi:uncharacterized phage protein gp47/JayE